LNDTLRVRLVPSRGLALAVVAAHLAAAVGAAAGLPLVAAAVAGAGLAVSLLHYWRWATQRSPQSVATLELAADGRLAVAGPGQASRPAQLRYAAVPTGWLAILIARDDAGCSRSALVLPDALDPETFRRLRVALRWRAMPGRDAAPVAADDGSR
jgi:toxin CptA